MKKLNLIIIIILTIIIFSIIGAQIEHILLNFIQNYGLEIKNYSKIYPVLTFLIFIIISVLLLNFPIPLASATFFLAGLIYGNYKGTIINIISSLIAAYIAYKICEKYFHKGVKNIVDKYSKSLYKNVNENTFFCFLNLRALNIIPYSHINYIAGSFKVKKKEYYFATFLGSIPSSFILAYLGSKFQTIVELKELITTQTILIFGLYILAINSPILIKYLKNKNIFQNQ